MLDSLEAVSISQDVVNIQLEWVKNRHPFACHVHIGWDIDMRQRERGRLQGLRERFRKTSERRENHKDKLRRWRRDRYLYRDLVELNILVEMFHASLGIMTEQKYCLAIKPHINLYHSQALTLKNTSRVNSPHITNITKALCLWPCLCCMSQMLITVRVSGKSISIWASLHTHWCILQSTARACNMDHVHHWV